MTDRSPATPPRLPASATSARTVRAVSTGDARGRRRWGRECCTCWRRSSDGLRTFGIQVAPRLSSPIDILQRTLRIGLAIPPDTAVDLREPSQLAIARRELRNLSAAD